MDQTSFASSIVGWSDVEMLVLVLDYELALKQRNPLDCGAPVPRREAWPVLLHVGFTRSRGHFIWSMCLTEL